MASYLIDTNVLVTSVDARDPNFNLTASALADLRRRRQPLFITPQVLIEYYRVCTRPAGEHGLAMTPAVAAKERELALRTFSLLPERPEIFFAWKIVVDTAQVRGKQVHDARLVAVCHAHGVDNILTFNTTDFTRFEKIGPGIGIVAPDQI